MNRNRIKVRICGLEYPLRTDDDAVFDAEVVLDASAIEPFVTWGTNPGQGLPLSGRVPGAGPPAGGVRGGAGGNGCGAGSVG